MMGGVRTVRGVPPSSMASDQRSSVVHSRGVDRAIDSPLVVTAVGAAGVGTRWRRVTRCGASMRGRAAMMGGVRTAHGVLPSSMASDQRSSVGHSRGVDRAIDSPLVVTAVGAAVAATLWRRVTRYGDANCSDMNTRASYRPRAMRTKPNFEQSS